MSNLYDEKGEYIGWKDGKPFWKFHGKHVPMFIKVGDESDVVCEVCMTKLYTGEYQGTPKTSNLIAISKITGAERFTYKVSELV